MIVEMYGTCDGKDILFDKVWRNKWKAVVPPDFTDGMYVVDIYARLVSGAIAYYTAILYMCDGEFVSLKRVKDMVQVMIQDNRHFYTTMEKSVCEFQKEREMAALRPDEWKVGVTTYVC